VTIVVKVNTSCLEFGCIKALSKLLLVLYDESEKKYGRLNKIGYNRKWTENP
jgi:hypothetical protein